MIILTDTGCGLPDLSARMLAIASLVEKGETVADIGCDHGYISIWLYRTGTAPRCIASDINPGPVKIAEKNIELYGASDGIETRIGSGLKVLRLNEADTAVIAGMGGRTIKDILTESPDIAYGLNLILSPQSEIAELRRFLYDRGFCIVSERFIKEDGKYYTVFRAQQTGEKHEIDDVRAEFGPCLLDSRDSILKEFILQKKEWLEMMTVKLSKERSEKASERVSELITDLDIVKKALEYYE